MNSPDDFLDFVRVELGLPLSPADLCLDFDQLPGWDSVHMLRLLTAAERRTGRRLSLPDLLDARTLNQVFRLLSPEAAP